MKTVPVLLKRTWATPMGRFRKSVDGIPTDVPERVIKECGGIWPLPRDAKIVGDDYKTPEQQRQEDEFSKYDDAAIAARAEAEANKKVADRLAELEAREAELAAREAALENAEASDEEASDEEASDEEASDEEAPDEIDFDAEEALAGTVGDIKETLVDREYGELEAMLEAEKAGKNRSSLVVEIEAAMEDFE